MKKKILAAVLVVILVLGTGFMLAGCKNNGNSGSSATAAPKGVSGISSTENTAGGGATIISYRIGVTQDTDWASMSRADKEKIIDYSFKEVARLNEKNDVRFYNIVGVQDGSGNVLFGYDKESNAMVVYKGEQEDFRIPAPAK